MFNSNQISNSGAFPLDYIGYPVSGAMRYPELVNLYPNGYIRLENSSVQNMQLYNSSFFGGIVKLTATIIDQNI